VCILVIAPEALAFTVGTGFTDPCHERFAMAAYFQTRVALPLDRIPEPDDGPWEAFVDEVYDQLGYPPVDRKEKFYFASLLAGVRANDTDGHSTLNLNALRSLHVLPELQYEHFLRAQDDDYEEGNQAAIDKSRAQLLEFFELIREHRDEKSSEQIIRVNVNVDFHGEIEVDAWAVAFYLGKALHTMHDSFSHTIRTDDMSKIIQVLNYAEAVSGNWKEERDGLRHSEAMDECNREMGPVLDGLLQASVDLVFAASKFIDGEDEELTTLRAVMDKWLVYEPGCDMSNNYCDSPWAERARDEPTLPYMEAIFGCSCAHPKGASPVLPAGLVLIVLCFRRGARKGH
jgi:uncharacterized protein (TIGR03382 family)